MNEKTNVQDTTEWVLHILRNPYGHNKAEIKTARLIACDIIERVPSLKEDHHELKKFTGLLEIECKKSEELRTERDKAVEYIEGILNGFKDAGREDEYILEKFKLTIEHIQEFLELLKGGK